MQAIHPQTTDSQRPFISFIVPVYNVPTTMLRECIQSILALTLRTAEREIIVVDDGSDDSVLTQLDGMTDQLLYVRQKNNGVSTARNLGLRLAQGAFLQFIDGDDQLLPAAYGHVIDLLRYDKTDMVMFDFTDTLPATTDYDDLQPMAGSELMRTTNIHGSVWGYVFSRSILGSLRFTPGIAYGEDEEFTAQLTLRAESVVKTTARAYYYRLRPMSAINTPALRSRLRRLSDARDVLYSLQRKADTMPADDRAALQRRTAQLTMDYIYNVILLTQNQHFLERKLDELRRHGLFPLPDRDYTAKYTWFRRMTNTKLGRLMLLRAIPLMKKER